MRDITFDPSGRRRPAPFGPRPGAPFTVDDAVGPVPRGRRHHGDGRRGRGRGSGGRSRAGRGDVRAAILLLLDEQPMHGYQIIQEIGERTQGAWTPSPGAVYPAIGLLTDEGLVATTADGGRNLASLTEAGRTYVEAHAEALGNPWESAAGRGHQRRHELRRGVEALTGAARQVGRVGTDPQVTAALAALETARREIYLILAGETPANDGVTAPRRDDAGSDPGTEG